MKNKIVLSMVVVGMALSACSPSRETSETHVTVSASAIASLNAPASEKAEEYAKAAELLLTAQGIEQADRLVSLALKEDSGNVRAGLIKAILAPIILQKGLLGRIKPLHLSRGASEADYQDMIAEYKKSEPNPQFAEFIVNGAGDITTEVALQRHMDKLIQSFENLRAFAKKNKGVEITLKGTTFLVPDLIQRYANACEIKSENGLEFELVCPNPATRFDVTLNRGDFEFLSDMASFLQVYAAVMNSYDLSGGLVTNRNSKEKVGDLIERALRNPEFGRLREQQTLTKIKSLGLDLENGLRWAAANQGELCPKGMGSASNRAGKWLNSGFCVHPAFGPALTMLRETLNGTPQEVVNSNERGEYRTKMHLMNFLNNPVRDLHTLAPMKIDNCSQFLQMGDATLGGIYPNGDGNLVLAAAAQECRL